MNNLTYLIIGAIATLAFWSVAAMAETVVVVPTDRGTTVIYPPSGGVTVCTGRRIVACF